MTGISRRRALLLAGSSLGLWPGGLAAGSLQGGALRFDVYKDSRGGFRWKLKAGNGQTIADSGEGYKTKRGCLDGIARVQSGAATATIRELT